MGGTVYDFIGTKNGRLAKFCDQHPNIAGVLMKVVVHCESMSRDLAVDPGRMGFECKTSPDGKIILIRIVD